MRLCILSTPLAVQQCLSSGYLLGLFKVESLCAVAVITFDDRKRNVAALCLLGVTIFSDNYDSSKAG